MEKYCGRSQWRTMKSIGYPVCILRKKWRNDLKTSESNEMKMRITEGAMR